ncbi:MAG: hypothetical protein Q4B82_03035 [Alysiella sp.]|uniref:hypothetical protein n=1 Tax=Alysiella sp. TaxID=1872483 RepID=UPI0026DC2F6D|nr:hypothetical protein [Alysiella sp.]MDO4433539.1 hypothetical protein [Alysiella sp.]
MISNADLPVIPAKRYFTLAEAGNLAGLDVAQITEWQQQEGMILGKGANTLTRLDVIKLRQLRHSISDYFAKDALDADGMPVISADEMRLALENMLADIEKNLAQSSE